MVRTAMKRAHQLWGWAAVPAVLMVLALTLSLLGRVGGPLDRASDPQVSVSDGGSAQAPGLAEPTEPAPPFSVVDRTPLTLPEEVRFGTGVFALEGGRVYVVRFDLTTVKPESEPGIGMYLNVSFSCQEHGGRGVGSIGGTENLVPGDPVTYANQLLLRPARDGVYRCGVLASAPNDKVAAKGATVQLDSQWRVSEVDGAAVQADTARTLPQTLDSDATASPLQEQVPIDGAAHLETMFTMHVTTCTGVNGSREDGRAWCSGPVIDERGNSMAVQVRTELLDENGTACAVLEETTQQVTIDKWVHHDLVPLHARLDLPAAPCGTTARTTVSIHNFGPAAVVLHESNTSLIVTTSTH